MNEQPRQKMQFTSLSDRFRAAAYLAAVYLPLSATYHFVLTDGELAHKLAFTAATYVALRTPYLRQIPLFLGRILYLPKVADKIEASPELQTEVDELLNAAGSKKKVKAYLFREGGINNAFAFAGNVYFGSGLYETLSKEQRKFILAHEVSHVGAEDMSERYLFWPPCALALGATAAFSIACLWNTYDAMVNHDAASLAALPSNYSSLGLALCGLALSFSTLWAHSRFVEYRADKNAVRLTGDAETAIEAMKAIGVDESEASLYQTWKSTHPLDKNRLDALAQHAHAQPQLAAPAL